MVAILVGITQFLTISSIIAIVENVLLMPIILFKSGKDIGSYKWLLFFYCSIAVIYLSIAILVVPILSPGVKGWLFYATESRVSQIFGSRAIATFANCYIMLMLILEFSFIYRYFCICRRNQLKWFGKFPHVIAPVVFYIAVLLICGIPIYVYMCQNPEMADIFDRDTVNEPVIDLHNVSYVGSPMFREDGWPDPGTTLILFIWTVAQGQFTIVCVYCIRNIMKCFKTVHLSDSSRKMQVRLFSLLVGQTIIPCIFTFFPAQISYFLAYARHYVPQMSQSSTALLPIAHMIDPVMILLVVTDYRRYAYGLLRKAICLKNNSVQDSNMAERNSPETSHT